MNKFALIVAVGAGIAGFGGAALAADATTATGGGAPSFTAADTNQDGSVDFGEAVAAYPGLDQNNFDQADTNKDGKLTAEEYVQLGGEQYDNVNNQASSASSDPSNPSNPSDPSNPSAPSAQ